jgi:hypothetical protein
VPGTANACAVLGEPLVNLKGRDWVVIWKPGATLQGTYNVAAGIGMGAAAAATFGDQSYALLMKRRMDRENILPAGWRAFAPSKDRRTMDSSIIATLEYFCSQSQRVRSNIFVDVVEAPSGIWDVEELMAHVRFFTLKEFTTLQMKARRAASVFVKYREEPDKAPLYKAVVVFGNDLRAQLVEKEKVGGGVVQRMDDPNADGIGDQCWDDAPQIMKALTVVSWDEVASRAEHWHVNDFVDSDRYLTHALFVLGPPGYGKSVMLKLLCKQHCIKLDAEWWCFSKRLDPLGNLSRWGIVQAAGAIAMTDMDYVTARNDPLSFNELKEAWSPEVNRHLLITLKAYSFSGDL